MFKLWNPPMNTSSEQIPMLAECLKVTILFIIKYHVFKCIGKMLNNIPRIVLADD